MKVTNARNAAKKDVRRSSMTIRSARTAVREKLRKLAGPRAVVTVPEAGSLFGLTRSGAYRMAGSTFPVIRMGSKLVVSVAALEQILGCAE
jgi:hypothetical protein